MKYAALVLFAVGVTGYAGASRADNPAIENALKRRPDLSEFYQAMMTTGVNHDLHPDMHYTVFAPTNAAFKRIAANQYPCFYMQQCRAQVADIVRNHIVHGDVYMDDAAKQKGGLYSIAGRFIPIGESFRNDYIVDGNNVVYTTQLSDGMLYKIDGLIANPREMASFQFQDVMPEQRTRTVTTRTTIPDTSCPGGCPDSVTTTTVMRTVPTFEDAPQLTPGR